MEKGYIMVQLQELLNRIPDYFDFESHRKIIFT